MKLNKTEIIDRNESVTLMGPLLISDSSRHRAALSDLAVELAFRWMPGLFPEK